VKLDGIDIDAMLAEVELTLLTDKTVSPSLASMIKVLILAVKLLTNGAGLNSSNSSNPPSSDPNRLKPIRKESGKEPGGQNGHTGSTLRQIDAPDEIEQLKVDRRTLPKGHEYNDIGIETRQVFDIELSRIVTEYQAQVLQDETGKRFVAVFPDGVTKAVQYGNSLKSHAVYIL
jgi:transposase